jgi:hypothetical protein
VASTWPPATAAHSAVSRRPLTATGSAPRSSSTLRVPPYPRTLSYGVPTASNRREQAHVPHSAGLVRPRRPEQRGVAIDGVANVQAAAHGRDKAEDGHLPPCRSIVCNRVAGGIHLRHDAAALQRHQLAHNRQVRARAHGPTTPCRHHHPG